MRISDWSSDVCSSDLQPCGTGGVRRVDGNTRSCGCLRGLRVECNLPGGPRRTRRPAVDGLERQCDAARTRGQPESGAAGELECSRVRARAQARSEEHTPELQSLMRISYAVFCLKKKN